jgi:hypothetical protein
MEYKLKIKETGKHKNGRWEFKDCNDSKALVMSLKNLEEITKLAKTVLEKEGYDINDKNKTVVLYHEGLWYCRVPGDGKIYYRLPE